MSDSPPNAPGVDPDESPEPIAIDLERRLAFLGLTKRDARSLQRLAPAFDDYAEQFVEAFYQHLFRFPETARFLQDAQLVARLKQAQQEHFRSLLAGRWDEAFVASRQRVGSTHAERGIEPQFFLGAYQQYIQHSFRHFAASQGAEALEFFERISPLIKAILLDIGLTLDVYFHQLTRELRSALELVSRANIELRQFARLTSHDLKTPLATVANLVEETVDEFGGQMPEEAVELLHKATSRIYRMSTTIDELLSAAMDFSHEASPEEVACEPIVRDAAERLRPILESKGIDLAIQSDLPAVLADRVRLREAIYNVLSNAAKFIDQSPGRIDIRAEGDADTVTLVIADNGPGIPAEELQRVFAPFRRLARHRDTPGSGLGLYFTKNLVEQQGGRVWAESTSGQGSSFHIQLARPKRRGD